MITAPPQTIIMSITVRPELIPDGDVAPLMEVLAHLEPVLDAFATVQQQYQIHNFEDQGQTFGFPWDDLAPATLKEKARLGYPEQSLVRRGRIASEIGSTVTLTQDGVSVGINADEVPEARYAQEGLGQPQRILVAVTDAEAEEMYQILRAYVAAQTGQALTGVEITATVQQ